MHAIFDNATTYNGATSDIGKLAAELKRVFDQKLAEMALAVKDRIRQRMIDESLPAAPPPPPAVGPPPRQRSLLAPPPRSRSRNESEVSDDDDLPYAPSKPASSSAAKFGGKRPAVTFRSSGSTPRKRARPVISFGKGKRPRKYVAGVDCLRSRRCAPARCSPLCCPCAPCSGSSMPAPAVATPRVGDDAAFQLDLETQAQVELQLKLEQHVDAASVRWANGAAPPPHLLCSRHGGRFVGVGARCALQTRQMLNEDAQLRLQAEAELRRKHAALMAQDVRETQLRLHADLLTQSARAYVCSRCLQAWPHAVTRFCCCCSCCCLGWRGATDVRCSGGLRSRSCTALSLPPPPCPTASRG